MQKIKNAIDTFLKLKEFLVIIAAILLWVLAVWFSNSIAPFNDRISLNESRINAQEVKIQEVDEKCNTFNHNLVTEIKELRKDISEGNKVTDNKIDNIYKILINR